MLYAPIASLDDSLRQIEARFPGARLGVAAYRFGGATYAYRGQESFPLQSVFKFPLAVVFLRQVDAGKIRLDGTVTVRRSDLSVPRSPLSQAVLKQGPLKTTWRELITRSVGESDNTAADILMAKLGGPQQVTSTLRSLGVTGVRIDRAESRLQCEGAGIPRFEPSLASESGFQKALGRISKEQRLAAYRKSLRDPRDAATPLGTLTFLKGYETNGWLRPSSKAFLDKVLFETTTGHNRLKAGFGRDWKLRHKTGTGRDVYGPSVARNDIGIATHPNGRKIAVVIYLTGASGSDEKRDAAIAQAARLVVASLN